MDLTSVAQGGGVVAVVVALTQVLKSYVPEKYTPLLALGIGIIAGGGILLAQGRPVVEAIIQGVVIGLVASGAYDQKALITK